MLAVLALVCAEVGAEVTYEPIPLTGRDAGRVVAPMGGSGYFVDMWNASWQNGSFLFDSQQVSHITIEGETTSAFTVGCGGTVKSYTAGTFNDFLEIDAVASVISLADGTGRSRATVTPMRVAA